jgi:hypothetical protein
MIAATIVAATTRYGAHKRNGTGMVTVAMTGAASKRNGTITNAMMIARGTAMTVIDPVTAAG